MTESISAPAATEASPRPDLGAAAPAGREGRLFTWLRSLGIVRMDGWAGGVCGGVAERIGVDPIVVRGVAVVLTVLGFPLLVVYAIAWIALPDERGRIPLQLRPGSGNGVIGAVIAVALGVAHAAIGASVLDAFDSASAPGRFAGQLSDGLIALSVVGAFALLIAWLARRDRPVRSDLPGDGEDGGLSGTDAVSGGAASGAAPPLSPAPEPPAPLGASASAADLEAWRAQHAAWRVQHDQWRRAQVDGDAAARAEDRARRAAERVAFRAEAARLRAERRAAKPRTSLAFVTIAAGAALVASTGVWLAFQPNAAERAWPAAVLAAAAVGGLAMIVAGVRRRRSGFLAAVTVVLLAVGAPGMLLYLAPEFVGPGVVRYPPQGQYEIVQPFGDLQLEVGPWEGGAGTTTVEKGTGDTHIQISGEIDVTLEAELGAESQVWVNTYRGGGSSRTEEPIVRDGQLRWEHDGGTGVPRRTIVLDQAQGDVYIDIWED